MKLFIARSDFGVQRTRFQEMGCGQRDISFWPECGRSEAR
jgi:hypothetical protein